MGTAFTIFLLLVFLSSLGTTESKSTPFQNENTIEQEQSRRLSAEEECDVHRPDGTCQWGVGKKDNSGFKLLKTRQTNCNRKISPNCRVMMGKKWFRDNIDCSSSYSRRSFLCRIKNYKRMNSKTPCDKRSENCPQPYMYKAPMNHAGLETKDNQKCDLKSPLCYLPFPGKRKPKEESSLIERQSSPLLESDQSDEEVDHKDSVTVTENDLLSALLVTRETTKLPYELAGKDGKGFAAVGPIADQDSDNSKPKCDPKRDFQCRFRIFGKREKTFDKATSPESYI